MAAPAVAASRACRRPAPTDALDQSPWRCPSEAAVAPHAIPPCASGAPSLGHHHCAFRLKALVWFW